MAYGVNAPFGLRPVGHLQGGGVPLILTSFKIATNTAGTVTQARSIFQGDPVYFEGTAANGGSGTITTIETAFVNSKQIGVFDSCQYFDTNNVLQQRRCWIGSTPVFPGTSITAFVYSDPGIIWEAQYSTSNNVLNEARLLPDYMGQNCRMNIGGGGGNLVPNNPASGNILTGLSARYIDGATDGTAATEEYKLLKYSQDLRNIIYDSTGTVRPFLNALILCNNHYFKSDGTIGAVAA